jgi:hypothetical protein
MLCSDNTISQASLEISPVWLQLLEKELNSVNVWYVWHTFVSYVLVVDTLADRWCWLFL